MDGQRGRGATSRHHDEAGPRLGDSADAGGGVLRRAGAVARTLLRPQTYAGTARELAIGALSLAAYPLGVSAPAQPVLIPYAPARRGGTPGEAGPGRGVDIGELTPETAWTPIVLVHGYFHNRSAFLGISRALRRAGFQYVHTMNYNPLTADMAGLAERLGAEVQRVLDATGAKRVQLVGHSMGGIVARAYVQRHGGHKVADSVITLGSPHRGTYAAHLGLGPAARELRPGSAFLRKLEESARPGPVRWISYYSDLDAMIVPSASGKLVHPALHAVNIKTRDTGHLSLLVNGEVLRGLVTHLSEPRPGRGRSRGPRRLRAVG